MNLWILAVLLFGPSLGRGQPTQADPPDQCTRDQQALYLHLMRIDVRISEVQNELKQKSDDQAKGISEVKRKEDMNTLRIEALRLDINTKMSDQNETMNAVKTDLTTQIMKAQNGTAQVLRREMSKVQETHGQAIEGLRTEMSKVQETYGQVIEELRTEMSKVQETHGQAIEELKTEKSKNQNQTLQVLSNVQETQDQVIQELKATKEDVTLLMKKIDIIATGCTDECASNPCENGATCQGFKDCYKCECSAGYTGQHCQYNIDECASSPCANGGTCQDGINGYVCKCTVLYYGSNCSDPVPRNCKEVLDNGHTASANYTIATVDPDTNQATMLQVFCDQDTEDGGWLVFQRRVDGTVNFYRGWNDYKTGFGNVSKEFWLGNKWLNALTSTASMELRIDLEDFENEKRYAKFHTFAVGPESDKYRLTAQGFSGNAGNSFATAGQQHSGKPFSTFDRDNDGHSQKNCASVFKGGWWYVRCHVSNLNGLYLSGAHTSFADGVNWLAWRGYHYSLKFTEMKFRPRAN